MFIDSVASFIWNPFMSLIYLEVGVLFLFLTGFIAWRAVPGATAAGGHVYTMLDNRSGSNFDGNVG